MKTSIPLVAILLLTASFAIAAPPSKPAKWLDDFTAAKAEATKAGKPILADFTGSDWCPWCIKLESEILSQKAFRDYAGTNLVLFIADFPRQKKLPARVTKQNQDLQKTYQIEGYPTVLLLDADGKVLGKTGYIQGGPDPFIANLKQLLDQSGWKPAAATNQTAKAAAAGAAAPAAKPVVP